MSTLCPFAQIFPPQSPDPASLELVSGYRRRSSTSPTDALKSSLPLGLIPGKEGEMRDKRMAVIGSDIDLVSVIIGGSMERGGSKIKQHYTFWSSFSRFGDIDRREC